LVHDVEYSTVDAPGRAVKCGVSATPTPAADKTRAVISHATLKAKGGSPARCSQSVQARVQTHHVLLVVAEELELK
jgi:hypothetical protein